MANSTHRHLANAAYPIGPAPAPQSYLNPDAILQAAADSGAAAIHPGYGFLSENAAFATQCSDAGIIFIGPSPATMQLMR